ncbi:MAG: methyl-accepting chemotaxis protein [Gammaproteobacteria bacterium]|nr:methyl-accepting chemotaxis protein [Gammaproteobacteria bacterium]
MTGLTIQRKITLGVLATLVVIFLITLLFSIKNGRDMVMDLVEQQTTETAEGYFDSLNVLMLSGGMGNREMLRSKVLEREGIVDFRILRGEEVSKIYGKGFDNEQPVDEIDHRSLKGESIHQVTTDDQGHRILTVTLPILAQKEYRGTNCLLCHAVAEDTVLGAVRVDYSLQALDRQLTHNIGTVAIIQLLLSFGSFLIILFMLRHFIFSRLNTIRGVMEEIEESSDLGRRITPKIAHDELGQLVGAFNSMMKRIANAFAELQTMTRQLSAIASETATAAEQAAKDIALQKSEMELISEATHRMVATVGEISSGAKETADTSVRASRESGESTADSHKALESISKMMTEIESGEKAIHHLGGQINEIEKVLKVIKTISHQTNLLALNAAIEAARAGAAGRGFAVVAEEVQQLAGKTDGSADTIRKMIESLQHDSQHTTALMKAVVNSARESNRFVGSSVASLDVISGDVAIISDMNRKVAHAAQEQNGVAKDIDSALNRIKASIDGSVKRANITAEASDEILTLSQRLNKLMSDFKL